MEIRITSRHSKASQSLRDTITDQLGKLEKFAEKITSCHVILDSEHVNKTVEINTHSFNQSLSAKGKGDSIGKALDEALERIERQLKKVSEKIKEHK